MDIVGSIGYIGQHMTFIDAERFAYATGNCISIYDTSKGPRDMIWRTEEGISCFSSNFETQTLIIAPKRSESKLEILSIQDAAQNKHLDNPSDGAIIALAVSKEGDRILALTDSTDHKLLVWSNSTEPKLLLSKPLDVINQHCSFNPCDKNQFYLYGNDGLVAGTLNEVLGEFTVKLQTITVERSNDPESDVPLEQESKANDGTILFATWLPANILLVGDVNGFMYEISFDTKSCNYLGQFMYPADHPSGKMEPIVPVQATLSINNIIVGTNEGCVYWYPLGAGNEGRKVIDFETPQQITNVGKPISRLAIDQTFVTLLIGTCTGEIHKIAVDVNESNLTIYDDADHDGQTHEAEKPKRLDNTAADPIGSDSIDGVVLCSNYINLDVQKYSTRTRSSLSMFVTGSHSGYVKFWRHSAQAIEPMVTGGGIRRSVPKTLSAITQLVLVDKVNDSVGYRRKSAAICCVEFVSLPLRHSRLVCLGTEDGYVQLWSIEAHENEDDDVKESGDEVLDVELHSRIRIVEDDEGGCLVRLELQHVYNIRLYQETVSILCPFSLDPQGSSSESPIIKLAVASEFDSSIHVITIVKNERILLMDGVSESYALDEGTTPRALVVHDNVMFSFCENGKIVGFKLTDSKAAPKIFQSGLASLADASLSRGTSTVVLLSSLNIMYTFPVRALNQEKGMITSRSGCKSFEHADVPVTVAQAPNGRYFATGTIGGSIYFWKIDTDDFEIYLANTIQVHSGPVSSMIFSACSSVLLSCGVDGSIFVVAVDKPVKSSTQLIARSTTLTEDGPQFFSDLLPTNPAAESTKVTTKGTSVDGGELTWLERRNIERAKGLKSQHRFKAMGITTAIGEIAERLEVLVKQNAAREELEQLDRSEFVIDVQRKNSVVAANDEKVQIIRDMYSRKNYCNELRAARIRAKCWDETEVKSTRLLPFSLDNDQDLRDKGVSSFSIQRFSSDLQRSLERVKRLRAMETRAQRSSADHGSTIRIPETQLYRNTWKTAVTGCPANVSWISNDGTRWPVSDKIATLLASDRIVDTGIAGKEKEGGPEKDRAANPNDNSTVEADDDDISVNSNDDDHEIDEHNILNLLYPPQAVRTQVQKRTQIILLKEIVRQIRSKFNEHFDQLRREKEDIIGSIESRNTRMKTILEDLRSTNENLFSPVMQNEELPGTSVTIDLQELTSRPYESAVARAQRLREEEEKRRRDLEKDKEDIKGRALEEMMHGTLEVKRDVFAEASAFVKPDWMDTLTPAEMNESQLKEYEAYQQKLKAFQEEQANYRKSLEQEMKKLKVEVSELCKAFDEKLEELSNLKILVHREILAQEIYVAHIAYSMARTEQTRKFLKKSEAEIQSLRADRAGLRKSIDHLTAHLEDLKTRINNLQEEERQSDKTFRRDLQNLCNNTFDQDTLKIFTQLYRRRTYPRGGYELSADNYDQSDADISNSMTNKQSRRSNKDASSRRHGRSQSRRAGMGSSTANDRTRTKLKASKGVSAGGGGRDSLGPMQQAAEALRSSEEGNSYKEKDPYYEALLQQEKLKLMEEAQIPILAPLSMELDCPEGFVVDQFSWSKLQELRNARIEKEIVGKKLSIEYTTMKQKLEQLESEEVILASCLNDIKQSRDESLAELQDFDTNLDIIVRLRQGQDEVDKDAVVTDYSEALLLPIDVINKYNQRIKELGKEKISVLSKIKLFRRKINLIDWEAKHHGLEAKHYEAYLTDLQLFRVTRELQKVIRDGADANQSKDRLDKVAQRREFLNNDGEMKLVALRKEKDALMRQLEERGHECNNLEKKISGLKSQVSLSKSVKISRDGARGAGGDAQSVAAAKMKKIITRRHMVDTARAQAEEIDFLRQELDKLRQRTFPSFVRATRKRLTVHPDGL